MTNNIISLSHMTDKSETTVIINNIVLENKENDGLMASSRKMLFSELPDEKDHPKLSYLLKLLKEKPHLLEKPIVFSQYNPKQK